jgi:hypothetical protein
MNTGLLFYLARRTSMCQRQISRYIGYYDLSLSNIKICAKRGGLRPVMSQLIATLPLVFIVSDAPERQPTCARPLFRTLRIPQDSQGEPKGVLKLSGTEKTGYLIESLNQAIVVLPDIPEEIMQMLPFACERLNLKFALNGSVPCEPTLNYEELVEKSLHTV